jgi:hypothetical protein
MSTIPIQRKGIAWTTYVTSNERSPSAAVEKFVTIGETTYKISVSTNPYLAKVTRVPVPVTK